MRAAASATTVPTMLNVMEIFAGRKLVIATMHGKEKVLSPILEAEMGVTCLLPAQLDTDALGTFSGEIERNLSPLDAARQKCLLAMEMSGCDLAVANEGSFGPHPFIYFAPADEEVLLLVDRKHRLEIWVREISTETNFAGMEIRSQAQLREFAEKVGFPSHALILRPAKDSHEGMVKGISGWDQLEKASESLLADQGRAYVETDMRAMHNPQRMNVIALAANQLIGKLKSRCDSCQMPGFGAVRAEPGLPCEWCGSPTQSTLSHIFECQACAFSKEVLFPHQRTTESARYCDHCNP